MQINSIIKSCKLVILLLLSILVFNICCTNKPVFEDGQSLLLVDCDTNYIFTTADSLLFNKLADYDDYELIFSLPSDSLKTDFEIGIYSMYLTLNGEYSKALEVLPTCLVQKFRTKKYPYERVDYNLGFYQNFAIWLRYYLYDAQNYNTEKRLLHSTDYNIKGTKQTKRLYQKIDNLLFYTDQDSLNQEDLKVLPLDIFFLYLSANAAYKRDNDGNKLADTLLSLANNSILMKSMLLEKVINTKLHYMEEWKKEGKKEAEILSLVAEYDRVKKDECLMAKISYADWLEIDKALACIDCINNGSLTDSIIAFAHLANYKISSGETEAYLQLLNEHKENANRKLTLPRTVKKTEYGLIIEAHLKYFLLTKQKEKFWKLAYNMESNPIVDKNLGTDDEYTVNFLYEVYMMYNGDDSGFQDFYLKFVD